jgi:hypothetical protein
MRSRERFRLLDLLQKSIFAPLAPQLWGEPESQSPPELGSQCGLGVSPSRAPGVDLGGISGFMQEVYCDSFQIVDNNYQWIDNKSYSALLKIFLKKRQSTLSNLIRNCAEFT